jgi:syntaxin-binding protein 1
VYILKPTRYTVECLAADYTRAPPRYAAAHVFFTPGLTDELALKVKNSPAGRYVRKIDSAWIDYWPVESQIFSLDDPFPLEMFYNRNCHDLVHRQVKRITNQLVSVCATLGEYPVIRFYKQAESTFEASVLPFMIANTLQQELDGYARHHPEFPAPNEGRGRSVFLVLDRSVDCYAPLLHEFTFQAMVYDLLPIKDSCKYTYKVERPTGPEEIEGVINEKDNEWLGLRHLHMQEVIDTLTTKMTELKKQNPHFADNGSSSTSVRDLQDMVASLPKFMETRDRFAFNLTMATECMNILQEKNLNELADLEQTLTLGVTADGRRSKNVADELVELLINYNKNGNREKVRLLILYALIRGGLIDADWQKLKIHANLTDIDLEVIRNMHLLGGITTKETLDKSSRFPLKKSSGTQGTHFFSHSTEDVYSVSRFVPGLKNILEDTIKGTLPSATFPYTRDEPIDEEEMDSHSSLRNPRQRAAWAKTTSFQASKQRMFAFMVGGITQSEARSVYELVKHYPKEIILGGNCILTPNLFLRSLSRLKVPREHLGLEIDQPLPRVPEHLFETDREMKKAQTVTVADLPKSRNTPPPLKTQTPPPQLIRSKTMDEGRSGDKKKGSKFGKFFK